MRRMALLSVSPAPLARVTMALALAGTLALAGCGRKGPLEPPPGAAIGPGQPQAAAPAPNDAPVANFGGEERVDPKANPNPRQKRIPLDNLLN